MEENKFKIHLHSKQVLPSACCILDQTKYPWTISPEDGHCVFVPTKYNSYWMQVWMWLLISPVVTRNEFQGCLPRLSEFLTQNTSLVILVIIFILTLEMIIVILAVCLCLLQKTRTDKTLHTVIVREHPGWKSETRARARDCRQLERDISYRDVNQDSGFKLLRESI